MVNVLKAIAFVYVNVTTFEFIALNYYTLKTRLIHLFEIRIWPFKFFHFRNTMLTYLN